MSETILKLIEEVSPDDTAKLDEIDARVWCYLSNQTFKEKRYHQFDDRPGRMSYFVTETDAHILANKYTRSRDALKSIRPEGYDIKIYNYADGVIICAIQKGRWTNYHCNWRIPTEELAELHAIIQAIAHTRQADKGE